MSVAAANPIRSRARRLAAALALTFAVAAVAPTAAHACAGDGANPNHVSMETIDSATVCLLNRERRSRGIRKLRVNKRLNRAARGHAHNMVERGFFAHGDFVGRIRAAGYLKRARGYLVAENIAWGSLHYATPSNIVSRWMNSPGHRANILNGRLREIGIGVSRGAPVGGMRDAATYVTDFGTRR